MENKNVLKIPIAEDHVKNMFVLGGKESIAISCSTRVGWRANKAALCNSPVELLSLELLEYFNLLYDHWKNYISYWETVLLNNKDQQIKM